MNPPITTFCDGGNCPSKSNCHRYASTRPMDYTRAALWVRREAGASACDMAVFVKPVTTFKDES